MAGRLRFARIRPPATRYTPARVQPHMRRLALAATLALTAACSPSNGKTESATPPSADSAPSATAAAGSVEPRTEAAVRAAATEEFDSYASGDYGATWDLYYAPAKKAISRADYMRALKLCPDPSRGIRFSIEKITMDSDHEAHVRVSRAFAMSEAATCRPGTSEARSRPTALAGHRHHLRNRPDQREEASDDQIPGGSAGRPSHPVSRARAGRRVDVP